MWVGLTFSCLGVGGYDLFLAGCGWVWVIVTFIWLGVGECDLFLAVCGWVWVGECDLFLAMCGWVWVSVGECGWVWLRTQFVTTCTKLETFKPMHVPFSAEKL